MKNWNQSAGNKEWTKGIYEEFFGKIITLETSRMCTLM